MLEYVITEPQLATKNLTLSLCWTGVFYLLDHVRFAHYFFSF